MADTHFSSSELSDLSALPGDAWLRGFYRCWTRKEAILKAEGVGLHRALDSFDVGLLPDEPAELLGTRKLFSHPWKLHDVSPAPGTIGALATAHRRSQARLFQLCFWMTDSGHHACSRLLAHFAASLCLISRASEFTCGRVSIVRWVPGISRVSHSPRILPVHALDGSALVPGSSWAMNR